MGGPRRASGERPRARREVERLLGRAVHPVFDLALLHGDVAAPGPATALLLEAGGEAIAVLADRILPAGDGAVTDVTRPSWDAMFAAP